MNPFTEHIIKENTAIACIHYNGHEFEHVYLKIEQMYFSPKEYSKTQDMNKSMIIIISGYLYNNPIPIFTERIPGLQQLFDTFLNQNNFILKEYNYNISWL